MFPKNDKRRLYELMNMYLSEIITSLTFCNEFYYCYNLELDHTTLTEKENKLFSELQNINDRFSPFEEDHKIAPKAYTTEKELYDKIVEIKSKLS